MQMLTTAELIAWAVDRIDRGLATLGRVERGVAIMSPGGVHHIASLEGGPSTARDEAITTTIETIRTMREAGTFAGLVQWGEAWLRDLKAPDRQEAIFVHAFGADGHGSAIWALERKGQSVRRGLAKEARMLSQGWLRDVLGPLPGDGLDERYLQEKEH